MHKLEIAMTARWIGRVGSVVSLVIVGAFILGEAHGNILKPFRSEPVLSTLFL